MAEIMYFKWNDTVNMISSLGFLPVAIPCSCLTMAPRFDALKAAELARRPLVDINGKCKSLSFNFSWLYSLTRHIQRVVVNLLLVIIKCTTGLYFRIQHLSSCLEDPCH